MERPNGNELKKEIRAAIPAIGARQISIRYESSYNIKVNAFVPLSKVKAIAKKYESYQRDQATGCILQGGNTFVFVDYGDKVVLPNSILDVFLKAVEGVCGNFGDLDSRAKHYHFNNQLRRDFSDELEGFNEDDVKELIWLVQRKIPSFAKFIN